MRKISFEKALNSYTPVVINTPHLGSNYNYFVSKLTKKFLESSLTDKIEKRDGGFCETRENLYAVYKAGGVEKLPIKPVTDYPIKSTKFESNGFILIKGMPIWEYLYFKNNKEIMYLVLLKYELNDFDGKTRTCIIYECGDLDKLLHETYNDKKNI